MIVVDPNGSSQGFQDHSKNDTDAKVKIDSIYQQLTGGADFADVARARSEDAKSLQQGGDIGFATEADLKQNGFPQDLISQFFGPLQVGSYTKPVQFGGRWYIFKLKEKRLQAENLTLNSPNVREQITQALTDQAKQVLNTALLEDAMSEAKISNNLAKKMLESPNNLSGPRPAAASDSSPAASPAASASASSSADTNGPSTVAPTPQAAASASPVAKGGASPKAQGSPKR
jgi:hypothetical protein